MKFSRINKLRWSAAEIAKRSKWHCDEHGHSGLTHPKCYERAHNITERVGGLDIEAGALNADFDITLSWAIKPLAGGPTWYDHITQYDIVNGLYDSRIIETLVDTLWDFDRVVTHYGNNARFDMPFIRSRYMWLDARNMYDHLAYPRFPGFGMLWQTDTFTMAKQKTKITSRRQGNIASCILNKDVKTVINKNHWMAIKYGSVKERMAAIAYIVEHNLADVEQLTDNYLTLLPFCREARTSI